uniref:Transposase n=1 Tax=Ascaris lumbricoides TaxID=6252 RepID=A0A0M3HYK1_ASCLU
MALPVLEQIVRPPVAPDAKVCHQRSDNDTMRVCHDVVSYAIGCLSAHASNSLIECRKWGKTDKQALVYARY